MSPLTEAERKKIIEEERIRADERAKYSQPQQVIVKEKRKTSGCTAFIAVLIVIGVVMGLVLTSLGSARDKARQAAEQAAPSQVSTQPVITKATFDVPSLVGKSLAQVKTTLGKPAVAPTPPAKYDGKDWEITWEKEGQDLMVSYDLKTSKIIDFFISVNGGTGSTADTNSILKIGNLKQNDPRYSVKFVSCKNCDVPNQYVGVTVTPK